MVYKRVIKGRDVYASSVEISVLNDQGEPVGGQFAAAFKLDFPPGFAIAGEFVRTADGKPRLFDDRLEAVKAAFAAAEEGLQ